MLSSWPARLVRVRRWFPDRWSRMISQARILAAIDKGFRDPGFDSTSLAAALGLSPRYPQQILASRNATLSHLLRERRIAETCRLLDRCDVSRTAVGTIAFAVGHADAAYFSRVFRRTMGMSPLRYAARGG